MVDSKGFERDIADLVRSIVVEGNYITKKQAESRAEKMKADIQFNKAVDKKVSDAVNNFGCFNNKLYYLNLEGLEEDDKQKLLMGITELAVKYELPSLFYAASKEVDSIENIPIEKLTKMAWVELKSHTSGCERRVIEWFEETKNKLDEDMIGYIASRLNPEKAIKLCKENNVDYIPIMFECGKQNLRARWGVDYGIELLKYITEEHQVKSDLVNSVLEVMLTEAVNDIVEESIKAVKRVERSWADPTHACSDQLTALGIIVEYINRNGLKFYSEDLDKEKVRELADMYYSIGRGLHSEEWLLENILNEKLSKDTYLERGNACLEPIMESKAGAGFGFPTELEGKIERLYERAKLLYERAGETIAEETQLKVADIYFNECLRKDSRTDIDFVIDILTSCDKVDTILKYADILVKAPSHHGCFGEHKQNILAFYQAAAKLEHPEAVSKMLKYMEDIADRAKDIPVFMRGIYHNEKQSGKDYALELLAERDKLEAQHQKAV